MKIPSPQQRVRRWHTYLIVWRLHHWLGLGAGALLVLSSVTGSILVLHHEVERWIHPERHTISPPPASAARMPVSDVLRELQQKAPSGYRPLRLEPGQGPNETDKYLFMGRRPDIRWTALVDPYNGTVTWSGPDQSLFTSWLLHLHMHLQMGRWGYFVTGLGGLALTLLSITGVWINRDRLVSLFRHPFRRKLGSRVALADLHKWVGMASLYFTFVLGLTGVWFVIRIVPGAFDPVRDRPPAPAFDLAGLAAIEPVVATARERFPDAELLRIVFPADHKGRLQVRLLHRAAPVWAKFSRMDFDPGSGRLLRVAAAADATASEKWQSILAPLHFGFYGAPWVKALYVAGGLAPAVLAVTGLAIRIVRRRSQRGFATQSQA